MKDLAELYKEISSKIKNELPAIKWIDLWHNQINFLEEENMFPSPLVFLSFRSDNMDDLSEKIQDADLQLVVYLFYETFADTFEGSKNQDAALSYLGLMTKIHQALHATTGINYSNMRRTGFKPVDSGTTANLYTVSFACTMYDDSAKKVYVEEEINDVEYNQINMY